MIFQTTRNELLEALTITGSVVGTSTLVPILSNYLFRISNTKIEITGGSMDVYIKNVLDIQESGIEACIALPKARIFDLLKDLPNQPLKVEIAGLKSKSPTIIITSLQGEYVIPIEDGETYPFMEFSKPLKIAISSANLLAGLDRTTHSCSDDQLRPAITGVYLSIKNDCVEYVSTNTNILSTITVPITDGSGVETDLIIPVKVLKILQNMPFDEMVFFDAVQISKAFFLRVEFPGHFH